jgi:hypothetical protein
VEIAEGAAGDDLLTVVRAHMTVNMAMWDNAAAAHRVAVEEAREARRAEPVGWLTWEDICGGPD